jgi:type I restriction enzyme S subunit
MSNWKEYKLSDVCLKIGSGATPRGGQESYLSYGEYTLIRSQNVLDFDFTMKGLAYIDEAQASKLNNVEIKERDILLNITGDSVARVCQVPSKILPARVNQHVAIIRPNRDIINNEYLKYYLLEPKVKDYLLMISSSGGTRNAITKNMLEELVIQAPNLPTQTAIAEILSSLDDKIELNNKINQELETLAQTLFKQWFIDFEFPNENGEPYKSSGGEKKDTELGEIPKGWQVEFLSDLFNFLEGPGLRNWQYRLEGMPFINIRLIQDGDIRKNNISYISIKEFKEKYQHFSLLENDLVLSTSGTLGKSAIVRKNHLPLMLNTSVIRFRPIESFCLSYMYQFLQSKNFIDEVKASATGSVQLNFGPVHLKKIKLIKPCESILNLFENSFSSVYNQIQHLRNENDELVKTRDYLLPKLISGELEINEITN